jgi:hypothetical protein
VLCSQGKQMYRHRHKGSCLCSCSKLDKTATCEVCMLLHVSWSHSPRQIFGRLRFVCLVLIIGMLVPRNTRVLDGRDDQRELAPAVMVMMMGRGGGRRRKTDRHTLLQRVDDRGGEHGRLTPPPPSDLICLPRLLISWLPSRICLHDRCTIIFVAIRSLEVLDAFV